MVKHKEIDFSGIQCYNYKVIKKIERRKKLELSGELTSIIYQNEVNSYTIA